MNKAQAIHKFWSSFGLEAYDESTVYARDISPRFPYITYNVAIDNIGNNVGLYGSLWYRSTSWSDITAKTEEIERALDVIIPIDGGYLWIKRGSPFAQRMSDPNDDMVRRMYINITAEFLTAY